MKNNQSSENPSVRHLCCCLHAMKSQRLMAEKEICSKSMESYSLLEFGLLRQRSSWISPHECDGGSAGTQQQEASGLRRQKEQERTCRVSAPLVFLN